MAAGCSTAFNERYYVGVFEQNQDGDVGPTQFYRFSLRGATSFGSKTKYEAGWYDADIVDRLFGEIRDERLVAAPKQTQLVQNQTVTDEIPILFAAGEIGPDAGTTAPPTNKRGASKVKAEDAIAESRTGKLTFKLDGLWKIRAGEVIVNLENGAGGTASQPAAVVIKSVEVRGPVHALRKEAGDWLTGSHFLDLVPDNNNGRLRVEKLGELNISGGSVSVVSDKPALKDERWNGQTRAASTQSDHHSFEWDGGSFDLLDGLVTRGFHSLDVTGGISQFKGLRELTATSGWLLRLRGVPSGNLVTENVEVEVDSDPKSRFRVRVGRVPPDKKSDPLTDSSLIKFSRAEHNAQFERLLAVPNREQGNPLPIVIKGATLEFSTSRIGIYREADSAAQPDQTEWELKEVKRRKFRVESLTANKGSFELSTTRAVEDAQTAGKTVRFKDPRWRSFMHFGPEGVGTSLRENERFVIFMTSNPRVLVNRIRALVNSKTTQAVIANTLFAPRLVEQEMKIKKAGKDLNGAKAFAQQISGLNFDEMSQQQMATTALGFLGQASGNPMAAALLGLLGNAPAQQPGQSGNVGEGG